MNDGDFILSNSMSFGRPYIMKTTGCIHDGWLVLRNKPEFNLDKEFLYYLLSSPFVYQQFNSLAAGSTVRNLNITLVSSVKIPVPPLKVQKQIVAKLDAFFKEYEILKQEKERAKENYEKISQSAFYKVIEKHKSKEFRIKELIDAGIILEIKSGFASGLHTKEGSLCHVRPMNVSLKGEMNFSSCKYVDDKSSKSTEYYLQKDDVIFNNTNSPELVGKTAVFDSANRCVYSNHMTRIRINSKKINPKYLAMYLHNLWRQGYFKMICRSHVSQASVNNNMLKEVKIQLPPIEEQNKIIKAIEELEKPIAEINTKSDAILSLVQQLPHSVLTKAFNGELAQ